MRVRLSAPVLGAIIVLSVLACRRSSMTVENGANVNIRDIDWGLVVLDGQPAPTGAGGRRATLRLDGEDGRASGFSGCNRAAGTYTIAGDSLRIGPLAMTKMACAEGMDLEVRYGALLQATQRFRVVNDTLDLLQGDSTLARFVRQ